MISNVGILYTGCSKTRRFAYISATDVDFMQQTQIHT